MAYPIHEPSADPELGTVQIQVRRRERVKCSNCHGSGRVARSGIHPSKREYKDCFVCDGEGIKNGWAKHWVNVPSYAAFHGLIQLLPPTDEPQPAASSKDSSPNTTSERPEWGA